MKIATSEQRWQELLATFATITDKKAMPIDPGILEAVTALNALGIFTSGSCEGHLDWGTGAPWIDIKAPGTEEEDRRAGQALTEARQQREAHQLSKEEIDGLLAMATTLKQHVEHKHLAERRKVMSYLAAFYAERQVPYDRRIIAYGAVGQTRIESQGAGLLPLLSREEKQQKLREYQGEMREFARFLKALFLSSLNEKEQ